MTPLIRLENVSFRYGPARPVLDGVSLALHAGQRIGLVGDIGSGKTSLLHLIVGLLRPDGGAVEAFGIRPAGEKDYVRIRRRAGLMFQDADDQLFCPTVAEDIAFGPVNLGCTCEQAHAIVHETLSVVGLDGYADRITYQLSAGEKRMVALATVLAMRPEVLLLDEPSANLDAGARGRLLGILAARHEAMLLVSHDLDMIRRLCTHVVRLRGGRAEPCRVEDV
ncbi:MAG: ABC transporter ATP-binding protein [Planctomycetes bacterium]|nr:ABC transporter ATP-binding protein [Planctomycetota bacterium]